MNAKHTTHLIRACGVNALDVEQASTARPARNQRNPRGLTIFLFASLGMVLGIITWVLVLLASLTG